MNRNIQLMSTSKNGFCGRSAVILAAFCRRVASGVLPPSTLVHPCTSNAGAPRYRGALIVSVCLALLLAGGCTAVKQQADPVGRARALVAEGNAEAGLALLEQAMKKEPTRLEYSNYYRALAVEQKAQERSIDHFKEQVAGGAPPEMYYNLAFAYIDKIPTVGPMGAGFLSKRAIAQFQKVLNKKPDDWIATYGIGMNYLHWPDYFKKNNSATDFLEKNLALQQGKTVKPYYILTYIRLGDAYAKLGQTEKAYAVWREGLEHFPDHPDLTDRVDIAPDEIGNAMRELYNPNNSIGEIKTDISVLWAQAVPDELVPLAKNPLKQAGVGGLLKASNASPSPSQGQIGLFSWFMRNLPFLSDKNSYASVDMSALGIGRDAANSDLASVVAHGMIMGFLSQFENDTPAQARAKADKLSAFHKPFFHEGLGMGYAATASLEDVSELKKLVQTLEAIDPHFTRLHLAGAGMWFGLEASGNLDKVKRAFRYLGNFGEAYAYEGYGFARTLFYLKRNPEILQTGRELEAVAAHSYYHGAGRALWILYGKDLVAYRDKLAAIPQPYRADAYSGYGMGVAFTKVEEPDFVFSYLDEKADRSLIELDQFLTGVTMGYVIRNMGEPQYLDTILAAVSTLNRCRVKRALQTGEVALSQLKNGSGDLHANWRHQIHDQLIDENAVNLWRECL